MRVVIVGASGNVGTALLRQLATDATVTSVVGVARRAPDRVPPAPYDIASWHSLDIGEDGPDEPGEAADAPDSPEDAQENPEGPGDRLREESGTDGRADDPEQPSDPTPDTASESADPSGAGERVDR